MGQRSATAIPTRPSDKTWQDFLACEVEHDTHEVHPTSWPPARIGNLAGEPSQSLPCVRCGTTCIVYPGHATGALRGVTVVLPEAPAPSHGGMEKARAALAAKRAAAKTA